jgi:hypothetical protein
LLFPQLPVSRWVCAAGVAICGLALAGLTRKLLGSTAG